jgi:23S rRNA (cytosine1962-C5)-methyltransferase
VAQFYDDEATVWAESPRRERVLDALHRLGFKGIYVKYRPKQANVIVDSRKEEFAPRGPLRGEAAPEEFVILEEGVPYRVRLGDGLSTGIFLDQRENRRRVREMSAGRSVLNLFSYTCGFSVAAAVGGAWRTVSVDASVNCLERGRGNLEEAQCLDRADHQFVAEDAFAWLAKAAKRGERFDLVILDPPSYSTTKSRRFSAESDYSELAEAALGVLAKGGRLLASSNHRGIRQAKFRKALRDAADRAGRAVAQLKDMPEPLDYPPPLGGHCHLKCALLTLER